MRLKTIKYLLLLVSLMMSLHASAIEVDGIYYSVNSSTNEAEVTYKDANYNSYSGDVVIPDKFTYNGVEYTVTSIGPHAFQECTSLTSVSIPNSVTLFNDYAFYNCSGLTEVTIPNSVMEIGYRAFSFCSSLTSVAIPNSVTRIRSYAFLGCSSLTSVTIPNSVTNIGSYAFQDCNNLASIQITDLEAWCNITYTINPFTNPYHLYLNGEEIKDLVIPNSVTSIGNNAFFRCIGLTSVTIPNSVTSIGSEAFYKCSGLTSVTIPSSVTSIGESAFYGCSSLAEIYSKISEPFKTSGCWSDVNKTIPLYVPIGSKAKYQSTDGWKDFKNIIETEFAPTGIEVNATNFPDEAFRNWVLQNVGGASDGILTDEEISKVTSIDCSGTYNNKGSISNLQGIEFLTALTELNCSYNQLTTLNVSKNTELKTLHCHSNKLTTLNVSNNTALTSLDCGSNQLTTLDVSYNTELDELRCHSNQLETLNVNNNTELTNLYCSSNKLTMLKIINNMKLGELRCSSNQLTTLSIGVKSLYILDCSSNQLKTLDVSYISSLQRLDCSSNQLTTLDVSNNWGLQDLSCSSNQLTKLDVSKNTALEWLKCESNQLLYLNLVTNTKISSSGTSITPQTATLTAKNVSEGIAIPVPTAFDFTKVSNLKLAGSNVNGSITTVNGQKYLVFAQAGTAQSAIDGKSLTYSYSTGNSESKAASMDVTVTLSYTETTPTGIKVNATNFPDEAFRNWVLQNVSGGSDGMLTDSDIANVTSIDCSGTSSNKGNISSLQGIEFFTALTNLTCNYNQLTTLEVSQNTALTFLSCYSNKLTNLDVSQNTVLTSLDCHSNQLTSLDVSQNTALTFLSCYSNQLTSLDVSTNTALTQLYCNSNQLTNLDVSQNTALTSLDCYSNQLTSLDVSQNTALTFLSCYSNQLTSLDVSTNTALTHLSCYSNQLTSLDVSKNTALTDLRCYSNQLTSLDLSKNTSISYCSLIQSFSQKIVSIAAGVAIPVPSEFDLTKVSDLKLADEIVTGSITTVNGQKYLVFAPLGTQENSYNWKLLSYNYDSGNSKVGMMGVRVLLTTASTPDVEINATNFPDEKFRNWIVENISGASDYLLTAAEIAKISSINCGNKSITSLQGIEFFVSLISLSCSSNKLTSLDVSRCTALTSLYCYNNQITTLDLSNNVKLRELQCQSNQLKSLNVTKNVDLNRLECYSNQLETLDVSNNTALSRLWCYSNKLTSLDLSKNTDLYILYCQDNQLLCIVFPENIFFSDELADITPQSISLKAENINGGIAIPIPSEFDITKVANPSLEGDSVSRSIDTINGQKYWRFIENGANAKSVDGKKLTYIYNLGWGYSRANSLDVTVTLSYAATTQTGIEVNATNFPDEAFRNWVLQNVSGASDGILTDEEIAKVTSIDCSGKYNAYGEMVNLKGIEFFTSLKSLTCRYNKLTSLNVSKNTALTSLDCSYNQLKSFDISGCTELTSLYCIENGMTSLNVSNNMALTSLSCYDNQLTSLNLSNHTALKRIDCQYNQLTNLNVSNCTALTYLQCNTNELTNLDVSTCTALANLYCHYNQLTSLDVSSNTNLKMLYCNNNQLTSLDVSNNTALTSLVCNANQLIYLNLGTNNKISDSDTNITSQTTALTARGISEGVAIPVPSDFDFSKVTNLKLGGASVTGSVATVNGQKYLVFAQLSTAQNAIDGKQLTYTYNTGNSYNKAASMDVTVTLSYTAVTYSLSIQSRNGGSVTYNGTTVKNTTQTFTVNEGVSVTITMTPDNGYRLASLTVNGTNVTSNVSNNKYTINSISANTTVVATFEQIPVTSYSLYIQSGAGGSVSFDGTTITNKTQSFTINEGTSATITITPNTGYKLSKLTVNGTNVTSSVSNNKYTINSISANTTVVVTFEQITYSLSVQATGNGTVTYNSTATKNKTNSFTVNHGSSATLSISPDNGYRLASLKVNGTDVTSSVSNNQYTISNITANTTVVAMFEQIPVTTYSLSIQSGAGGSVSYDGTTVTNKTQSFTVAEGSSVTIEMTPSNGYKLASLVVNGTDVTSGVANNQYTISNITANTTVVVTFKAIPQTISVDGINYEVKSATDYTLNVGKGNYSGHVVIPATVKYDGDTWTVAAVVDGAFNLSAITAITWNPNTAIGNGAFGAQTNPNLLLYVKSEAYAPTNVQNVIANGRAKKIVLTDAASGNDFNCPVAFTAEEISYTHRYSMTTGIGECRGWETIALPFTVQKVMHQTKGQLVTFKQWDQSTSAKPYWLYKLTYTGFAEADFIEANTPYVISMPNHEKYFVDYNLAGDVTFSAQNAMVKTSENMTMPTCNDKTFRPCFAKTTQSGVYAINAVNSWVTNTGGYKEGSVFVEGLRPVLPFEAYMTTSTANAKGIIPLFETQPTAIREIPMQGLWGETGVKVYSLNGQLVLWSEGMTREEALKRLPAGIYIMNGKKITIK